MGSQARERRKGRKRREGGKRREGEDGEERTANIAAFTRAEVMRELRKRFSIKDSFDEPEDRQAMLKGRYER